MSDKTNAFRGLLSNLQDGLAKMNKDAKAKAEGKPNAADEEVVVVDDSAPQEQVAGEAPGMNGNDRQEKSSIPDPDMGFDDVIEEGMIIDAEPEPRAKKKAGLSSMSMKQKGLLCLVAVGAVFAAQTMLKPATMPDLPTAETQTASEPVAAAEEMPLDATFGSDTTNSLDSGDGDLWSSGENAGASGTDAALAFDPNSVLDGNLNDASAGDAGFASLSPDGAEMIDPFSGQVATPQPLAVSEPAPSTQAQEADESFASPPSESPFGLPEETAPQFSGNQTENADSGQGELQVQTANANVAALTAQLAEKDSRIGKLQTDLDKAKKELDEAKQKLIAAQAASQKPQAKQSPAPTRSATPKHTERSAQPQRVASAPKAPARPQLCVSAVAQAARNCTTCVPHAFVKHKGVESMVGQGDYVEGLRVSIVGDRLDLQNSKGEVVHKFWSSPNGCAG